MPAKGMGLPSTALRSGCGMLKRYWWMLPAMAAVGMLAGLLVAAVLTYVTPKTYESFAMIEIKPAVRAGVPGSQIGPSFLPTEMEKIKARNTLMRAVDALDLPNKWGMDRESALGVLRKCVETENLRGTDLIRIRARHMNREDARDIAEEAARAYRDYRRELESKAMEQGISDIRRAVRNQEDKVEESRKIMITIARIKGGAGATDPADIQDHADAKRGLETEMALLEQLKLKLAMEEINRDMSGDVIVVHEDPVIADLPVYPRVGPNLAAGVLGGLLVSPFLALPLMLWMNRSHSVRTEP